MPALMFFILMLIVPLITSAQADKKYNGTVKINERVEYFLNDQMLDRSDLQGELLALQKDHNRKQTSDVPMWLMVKFSQEINMGQFIDLISFLNTHRIQYTLQSYKGGEEKKVAAQPAPAPAPKPRVTEEKKPSPIPSQREQMKGEEGNRPY